MHWSKGKKLLVRSLCVLTASSLMAAPAYAASATSITRLAETRAMRRWGA